MLLKQLDQNLYTFEFAQKLMPGVVFPTRSIIVNLPDDIVAVISPGPFDPSTVAKIKSYGSRQIIIAPNLFHHLYFRDAMSLFPEGEYFAPKLLKRKIKGLHETYQDLEYLPSEVTKELFPQEILGHSTLGEWIFFHHSSGTLIVTDLVFHMKEVSFLAGVILRLAGAFGRLAQSRLIRMTIGDKELFVQSVKALASFETKTVIMAHGSVIKDMGLWKKFILEYT